MALLVNGRQMREEENDHRFSNELSLLFICFIIRPTFSERLFNINTKRSIFTIMIHIYNYIHFRVTASTSSVFFLPSLVYTILYVQRDIEQVRR